jgi:hypothetical protein
MRSGIMGAATPRMGFDAADFAHHVRKVCQNPMGR